MQNVRFISIESDREAADIISGLINHKLADAQTVLWLISGGSFIKIAGLVREQLKNPRGLSVTLTDERYGERGHSDSNWRQLIDSGFNFEGVGSYEILLGKSIEETARDFEIYLAQVPTSFDYILVTLGMGGDGHTSGILPHSGLSDTSKLAAYYSGPDYKRITTTPKFISSAGQVIVYAVGEAKHQAINNLSKDLDLEEQPVQIIKSIKNTLFITDFKGDKL
jgi:6-phosphogluconolactonase/glucosamine-6-phosphate isomerase/deaminase